MIVLLAMLLAAGVQSPQRSPVELARAGWAALAAGRAAEADAAFREALQKAPNDPSLLAGSGAAAYLAGRIDDAQRTLTDALRQDPSLASASLLLGEILYRAGDLAGAISVYQQALANHPDNPQLRKRLDAWQRESDLHSQFAQRLGDHFTVLFEGPAEADLAAKAVAVLESAYWRIGTALNTYPPDVITVVLYTREQFRDITASPSWAGGVFDGRIRVPVQGALQSVGDFERVLTHEFTHALVRSIAPRNVPTWFNEGLAVAFEGGGIDVRKGASFVTMPQAEALGALRREPRQRDARPALSSLEGSFAGLDPTAAVLAYAESAAAVQRMLDLAGPNGVAGVLADLGRGLPFAEAFERNMFVPYADFARDLRNAR